MVVVALGIAMLPLAVLLDLKNLSDQNLRTQATTLGQVVSVFRSYYAKNVVARVNAGKGRAVPLHKFREVPGGIPIPATLSLELGEEIGRESGDAAYRFVSDYPFKGREQHQLSDFEIKALSQFRSTRDPKASEVRVFGSLFDRTITVASPVVMGQGCVNCHNAHPESVKTDWSVGDVRGVQSITVHQPLALTLSSFKWLLAYLGVAGAAGLLFAISQFSLAGQFHRLNAALEAKNSFLAAISEKIAKYLSPQVFKSIFAGEKDVDISTERKRLTIFFSDIKDFTATTERLQPEELTRLLNEYFSEMAAIAEKHGATIDKFIGDAIVGFFGDPETRGAREDARACVAMALEMQARLVELNERWHESGLENHLYARIGINTGYCNVGNFGSASRIDYTAIGAEANLAARMESISEPGGIVMSYETFVHAGDMVDALPMEPVRFKGIAREVIPYRVLMASAAGSFIRESSPGLHLVLDLPGLNEQRREQARETLKAALAMMEAETGRPAENAPAGGVNSLQGAGGR